MIRTAIRAAASARRATILRGLAAATVFAILPVRADTLYHCRDARGVSVYQDEPCAGALRPVGSREFAHASIDPALDPCRTAKARRDSTLKRVGLKRTYDLLSQLDGEVWDACKGF